MREEQIHETREAVLVASCRYPVYAIHLSRADEPGEIQALSVHVEVDGGALDLEKTSTL